MKRIIAATIAAVFTVSASAGTLFTMKNENGGQIEITDTPTHMADPRFPQCTGAWIAYAWGRGDPSYGCWKPEHGDIVSVVWFTGGVTVGIRYKLGGFTVTPYARGIHDRNNRGNIK